MTKLTFVVALRTIHPEWSASECRNLFEAIEDRGRNNLVDIVLEHKERRMKRRQSKKPLQKMENPERATKQYLSLAAVKNHVLYLSKWRSRHEASLFLKYYIEDGEDKRCPLKDVKKELFRFLENNQ